MGYLLLRRFVERILRLYFVCSVFFYTDCNKRGQTSPGAPNENIVQNRAHKRSVVKRILVFKQ